MCQICNIRYTFIPESHTYWVWIYSRLICDSKYRERRYFSDKWIYYRYLNRRPKRVFFLLLQQQFNVEGHSASDSLVIGIHSSQVSASRITIQATCVCNCASSNSYSLSLVLRQNRSRHRLQYEPVIQIKPTENNFSRPIVKNILSAIDRDRQVAQGSTKRNDIEC